MLQEQNNAIQLVRKMGKALAAEHPEIAELYRAGARCHELAPEYVSDAAVYPIVAERAVNYAVRLLIPRRERMRLMKKRKAENLEKMFGGFKSEAFSEHCRNAVAERHKKHGIDSDALTRSRGQAPWSEGEKKDAEQLSKDPNFSYRSGHREGMPCYRMIAEELDRRYHTGRKPESICTYLCYLKAKKNK